MSINDISGLMSTLMLRSMMNTQNISPFNTNNAGQTGSSSNAFLFEALLKSMMSSSQNQFGNMNNFGCNCMGNNMNNIMNNMQNMQNRFPEYNNNLSNNYKVETINNTYEKYASIGDFHPMGKAPALRSKDINIDPRIDSAIKVASRKYGVEESFVRGIIKQESNFNPNCKSGAGAMGLMQLMSYNCKEYGVKNPYNIEENINGGVQYIRKLLDKFHGNKQLALSAYNGGITRMNKRGVDTVPEIINMPRETQGYVTKVMGYYNQYKEIQYV